ncbi:MAG: flavodoxin family protein [Patescibacteria group bacterium]
MNILIVYDSQFGNTEKIAKAMAEALTPSAPSNGAKLIRAGEAKIADLENIDLLIIGSPTQAGRPLPSVKGFLNKIPADGLKNIKVASFDTRMKFFFIKIFGYAADRMAKVLQSKGGNLVVPPMGFIVSEKEGPLKEGELERAAEWAKDIINK